VLLGIPFADQGNPDFNLWRPRAASHASPDEDGPDACSDTVGVGTVTLRLLAEYPDLQPVVTGAVPGSIRDMTVINVD
jgi:hypothetical protein